MAPQVLQGREKAVTCGVPQADVGECRGRSVWFQLMNPPDVRYALAAMLNPALGRVSERAERGQTLKAWGLKPHRPDPGTPMAKDDADGYYEKIPEGLSGTVMYPIMNAIDAIASTRALVVQAKADAPFNHHPAAFLSLCRTAVECSAQAIWIMSSEDRDARRKRAAGLAKVGIEHAREWHGETQNAHDNGLRTMSDEAYAQNKHRFEFHTKELEVLETLEPANARQYSEMVRKAANWIAANPPKHTSDVAGVHYQTVSKLGYRVCSSFTHGHAWPIHLLGNPMESFGMMADSINLALINTECALSLYEAQSTDPNGSRTNYYPERLQVTIDDWRTRY